MTKAEKSELIAELSEKFQNSTYFYICDANGMTVEKTNAFRRMCFERGIEYKVYKNTLIAKALLSLDGDYTSFEGTVLKGMSGIMFTDESGKKPAKLLKEFYSKNGGNAQPVLKGASIDLSAFVGANQLDTLLNIKSKQELIGEIIGLLQSPAKNVVSALQSGGGKLAGILKTLSEKNDNA